MGKKIKKMFKVVCKLAGVVCLALVGILIVCGLPFDEIKEKLKRKIAD